MRSIIHVMNITRSNHICLTKPLSWSAKTKMSPPFFCFSFFLLTRCPLPRRGPVLGALKRVSLSHFGKITAFRNGMSIVYKGGPHVHILCTYITAGRNINTDAYLLIYLYKLKSITVRKILIDSLVTESCLASLQQMWEKGGFCYLF